MSVEAMIERGELERVEPDPDGAATSLEEASLHAESVAKIVDSDANGAYQLTYDAARKAVVACMRRDGLRVRRGEGAHSLTARYAAVAIDRELGGHLEAMRRRRNRSEYGNAYFERREVEEALSVARALIARVAGE